MRLVVQRGLAEPFFEDTGWIQQVVGNDGIEHSHAPFVEHAHDRLVALKLFSKALTQLLLGSS